MRRTSAKGREHKHLLGDPRLTKVLRTRRTGPLREDLGDGTVAPVPTQGGLGRESETPRPETGPGNEYRERTRKGVVNSIN